MKCDVCPALHICYDPDGYSDDIFCNITGERDPGTEYADGTYGCKRTKAYIERRLKELEEINRQALEKYNEQEDKFWKEHKEALEEIFK